MKFAVIDIGSNSVRLMMRANGITLYKKVCTTRLGDRLSLTGALLEDAMARTSEAVACFVAEAKADGAEQISVFATAAVRSAKNGATFAERTEALCGVKVDVISGETEARIGLLGAVGRHAGAIVDVGGASTEISVRDEERMIYSKSVNVGTVRLFDLCGSDEGKLNDLIGQKLSEYGKIPLSGRVYAIGGTATTLAAVSLRLEPFDASAVNGFSLTQEKLRALCDLILPLSVEERAKIRGMDRNKLDVIGGGALLLWRIAERWGVPELVVSCADNLEGYAVEKGLDV